MSKGLEAKNRLVNKCCEYTSLSIDHQVAEDFNTIEKELKALEIIVKKRVAIALFKSCDKLEQYNIYCPINEKLTQEEWDLLKEVLL